MMISPKSYVEDKKDKSYKQLIEERNELIREIQEFERKKLIGDRTGDEWDIDPSPDVIYQCNLEYLAELCNHMSLRYNEEYVDSNKKLADDR